MVSTRTIPGAAISPNRVDPDLDAGQTDEFVVGLDRELFPNFVVGLNYSYRTYEGEIFPRRTGLTRVTRSCWRATSTGTLADGTAYSEPYYALRDGVEIPAGLTIENRPDWETEYHGIDLNFQKRLSNRWMAARQRRLHGRHPGRGTELLLRPDQQPRR